MAYLLRKMIAIAALVLPTAGFVQESCDYACTEDPCCNECCGRFFVEADLLYLRAFEGGLFSVCDTTEINDTTVDGIVVSRLNGRGHNPNFEWNLGYRVGVGYEFVNSCYDIGVYWTHFKPNTKSSGHSSSYSGYRNSYKWSLDFNVVDLLFSYNWSSSPCFVLTPFGGVRFAEISQNLHTHFLSTINDSLITSHGHIKQTLTAVGPIFGLEGDLGIGCGFSLYGNLSVGVLYGKFRVKSHSTEEFNDTINIDHLRGWPQAYQAVTDAEIGIRWRTCYCNNNVLIVELGLEQHRYYNHNQFCGYGDLNLDGASLGVRLEF
jgi:hypothetical protein